MVDEPSFDNRRMKWWRGTFGSDSSDSEQDVKSCAAEARDVSSAAQMLLAWMVLLGGHEQPTTKGPKDDRSCG